MAHDPSSRGWELRLEWLEDKRTENGSSFSPDHETLQKGEGGAGGRQCKIIDRIYIEFLKLTVSIKVGL